MACTCLVVGFLFSRPLVVQASDLPEEAFLDEFNFEELDDMLRDIFPDEKVTFREVLLKIVNGGTEEAFELFGKFVYDQFFYEFQNSRTGIVHILLIAIIAAVFTNFSNVFQNRQISEISFYVLYLLLITISLNAFRLLVASASGNVQQLLHFMKLLGPVYFLAVAFASGSSSSIMFYNLVLLLIYLVELLVLNVLIPFVQIYIVVKILNYLSSEEYLSKFAELLETLISWTMKTLLAGVLGLNLVQGLLGPAIDSLKRSVVARSAEAIPVVGDALGGVTEVMLGTAVLIKNGIGVTGAVVCTVICLIPIVQMAVITLMYKLTAAMIQPVSDKRIVGCISCIADGSQMLLRVVFTSGVLFLLTIAIVTATTSS